MAHTNNKTYLTMKISQSTVHIHIQTYIVIIMHTYTQSHMHAHTHTHTIHTVCEWLLTTTLFHMCTLLYYHSKAQTDNKICMDNNTKWTWKFIKVIYNNQIPNQHWYGEPWRCLLALLHCYITSAININVHSHTCALTHTHTHTVTHARSHTLTHARSHTHSHTCMLTHTITDCEYFMGKYHLVADDHCHNIIRGEPKQTLNSGETYGKFAVLMYVCMYVCM